MSELRYMGFLEGVMLKGQRIYLSYDKLTERQRHPITSRSEPTSPVLFISSSRV